MLPSTSSNAASRPIRGFLKTWTSTPFPNDIPDYDISPEEVNRARSSLWVARD